MLILIPEDPGKNYYITALVNAYQEGGHTVLCGRQNFFISNFVPDLLHIHWPEKMFQWAPVSERPDKIKIEILEKRLKWYKEKKTLIIYTVHDLFPRLSNNSKHMDEKLFKIIIEYSDVISHHCSSSLDYFNKLFPIAASKINLINPGGDNLAAYRYISRKSAREKLNIPENKFVILTIRNPNEYKGELFVKSVFNSCRINSKYLLVAGNYSYSGLKLYKKNLIKLKNYLKKRTGFKNKKYIYRVITEEEIPLLFNACDIVFVGHREGIVSGIISTAATYRKPVVYPDVGCFKEQAKDWVGLGYEAGNEFQACKALNDIYDEINEDNVLLDNTAWLIKNSWDKHAERIINEAKNMTGRISSSPL